MPKISGEIFPDGDFYLTKEESAMIAQVKQHFSRIAVVLNIGGIIDTSWIKNDDQISSALIAWQEMCIRDRCQAAFFFTQRTRINLKSC